MHKNLLASYTHLRHTTANPWVRRFLRFVKTRASNHDKLANAL